MELLKELASVVSKNKAKQIEIIGQEYTRESKIQKLYEAIQADHFNNEEEAAILFFPGSRYQKSNFNKLKRQLKKRLLNTLFFIDVNQPDFNDMQKAYYSCYKDFAALKILKGRSATKAALHLAEKILRKAQEFEFTDIAINILTDLRGFYLAMGADLKKLNECSALLNEKMDLWRVELLAEEKYQNLAVHFVKSRATKAGLLDTAIGYSRELEQYLGKYQSPRFLLATYLVFSLRYQIVNDYENTLRVCKEAVKMFERKGKAVPKTNLLVFLNRIASCQIQLGYYAEGEQTIRQCDALVEEGISNWFVVSEYHLILLFHSKQYQKAFAVFSKSFWHAGFKNLPAAHQERWKLYEAFIHFFIATGAIEPGLKESARLRKFRLRRFLNDVPEFAKDKQGANITILILQILFLLQASKYDDALPRLEALKAYSHRYLRKNDTFRSNCFIHMLLQVPKGYFNKKAVNRKAHKYVEKLKEMP
ncbi:MAG: hypothetical protein ACE5FF_17165, partial [Saprospiraceae bacterium]